jgi:hypothetical protein
MLLCLAVSRGRGFLTPVAAKDHRRPFWPSGGPFLPTQISYKN